MWGWEPREFHEYVYEDGHLVGAIVTREPEFTDQQRELLLAHLANEAEPRNQYGTPLSEATDQANQFAYIGQVPQAPLIDWQAAAMGRAQDAYYEQNKDAKRHGHIWVPKPSK